MRISIADIIIHIDESLPRGQVDKIEDAIRQNTCVISASAHDKTPHLMLVAYNPDCTTSKEVLDSVTKQGVHAESSGL